LPVPRSLKSYSFFLSREEKAKSKLTHPRWGWREGETSKPLHQVLQHEAVQGGLTWRVQKSMLLCLGRAFCLGLVFTIY
jgi:hypothetical protein